MVTPSCGAQTRLQIHLVAAVALVAVLVLAVIAFGESSLRRPEPGAFDSDEGHPPVRKRFLADMAALVGALAALVILAMWFGAWVLTPCEP
jgi:heme A synthase